MHMPIDSAGDHVEAARVDLALAPQATADGGDPLASDPDIGDQRVMRGDELRIGNHEIVAHARDLTRLGGSPSNPTWGRIRSARPRRWRRHRSEGVGAGGDPFEVRSHVGPEASEVELGVVLDLTQSDLGGGPIAALALRAPDREAIQDILRLLLEQPLDEGKVV